MADDVPSAGLAAEGSRLVRNSALLSAGSLVGLGLGFVSTVLITDGLGDDYGLLIGAQRFVGLFLMVASFGLHPLLVRAVAAGHRDPGQLFANVLIVRAGFGVLFAGAVPLAAWLTGYLPEAFWLLLAFVVIEFLNVVSDTYVALCEGYERMGRSALVTLSRSVTTFVGVLVASHQGGGLEAFVTVYLVSQGVQLAFSISLARGVVPDLRMRPRLAAIPPLLREAGLFVAVGFSSSAFGSLAVLALARMSVPAETARYGAALNFLDLVVMLPILVQRVLLPAFSRLQAGPGAQQVAEHSLGIVASLLFPAAVGLAVLADPILALYPSGEFADSAPVLRVIAVWLVFLAPSYVTASFLTGTGRLRTLIMVNVVAVTLQGALLLYWVPRAGAVGAAISAGTSFALAAAVQLAVCRADGVRIPVASMARTALAALVMGAALWPVREAPLFASVPLGVVVYGLVFFSLAPRDGVERRVLREGRELWWRS